MTSFRVGVFCEERQGREQGESGRDGTFLLNKVIREKLGNKLRDGGWGRGENSLDGGVSRTPGGGKASAFGPLEGRCALG